MRRGAPQGRSRGAARSALRRSQYSGTKSPWRCGRGAQGCSPPRPLSHRQALRTQSGLSDVARIAACTGSGPASGNHAQPSLAPVPAHVAGSARPDPPPIDVDRRFSALQYSRDRACRRRRRRTPPRDRRKECRRAAGPLRSMPCRSPVAAAIRAAIKARISRRLTRRPPCGRSRARRADRAGRGGSRAG